MGTIWLPLLWFTCSLPRDFAFFNLLGKSPVISKEGSAPCGDWALITPQQDGLLHHGWDHVVHTSLAADATSNRELDGSSISGCTCWVHSLCRPVLSCAATLQVTRRVIVISQYFRRKSDGTWALLRLLLMLPNLLIKPVAKPAAKAAGEPIPVAAWSKVKFLRKTAHFQFDQELQ